MNNGFPLFFTQVSERLGRYDEVQNKVEFISKNFPALQYPKLLDICCGAGHFTRALANKGYQTTGIDISYEQINLAKEQCSLTEYIQCDMKSPPDRKFDLIINTYSSFGYGQIPQEDLAALHSWYEVLRHGGFLIIELTDLEKAKHDFPWPSKSKNRVNDDVKENFHMDWELQLLTVTYQLGEQQYNGFTRIYSCEQLYEMLTSVGFTIINKAGDFNFTPKKEHQRLVLTCTK